ncbi:hypothetical protein Xthr_03465, partial [Xanthomonas citri pv. thirumalacharii]|nr:hypothetical protein [Xanthomonas citri pv. thirumalacharii]
FFGTQVSVLCAHATTLRQGGVLHLEVESKLAFAGEDRALEILLFAAGALPAHRRSTRCKYVPVSSLAASMPPRVP